MLLRTANNTLPCALFALLVLWYFIIYMGRGCGLSIVGKYGKSLGASPSCKQMLPNHLCKNCEVLGLK